MPKDQVENSRTAAELRVRETFAREAMRLDRLQEETRQRDALAQSRSLERAGKAMQELEERKREALERHERRFEEERKKFSPAPAPSFLGVPPLRPALRHYRAFEARFAEGREEIARQYDERISACAQNSERLQADFAAAAQARENQQDREQERLFREQADSFGQRVESELAKDEARSQESTLSREFGERARDTGPDIAG